jgi:L-threonylcarbamoyladenylate synthase
LARFSGFGFSGGTFCRRGVLGRGAIAQVLGPAKTVRQTKKPLAPGMKYRHYAPQARLILCSTFAEMKKKLGKADAVLGFADSPHGKKPLISLGKRDQAAANLKKLYAALRDLDARAFESVVVDVSISVSGLGATLTERLNKAAG